MYRPFYLVSLFILLFSQNTYGNDLFDLGQPYFETVGDKKVIPEGIIMTMEQDSRGFIWLGNHQGLFRYDGYRYKRYIHNSAIPNSIAGNYITVLWNAPDSKLWIGTGGDGISVYNVANDSFDHINHTSNVSERNANGFTGKSISAITGDGLGNVFVGSRSGLSHINVKTGIISNVTISGCENQLLNQPISALLIDKQEYLWVGSTTGLCRIKSPKHYPSALQGEVFDFFKGKEIKSIFEASNGFIWIGTGHHDAALYQPNSDEVLPIYDDKNKASGEFMG